jgi:hypothetical protein
MSIFLLLAAQPLGQEITSFHKRPAAAQEQQQQAAAKPAPPAGQASAAAAPKPAQPPATEEPIKVLSVKVLEQPAPPTPQPD